MARVGCCVWVREDGGGDGACVGVGAGTLGSVGGILWAVRVVGDDFGERLDAVASACEGDGFAMWVLIGIEVNHGHFGGGEGLGGCLYEDCRIVDIVVR